MGSVLVEALAMSDALEHLEDRARIGRGRASSCRAASGVTVTWAVEVYSATG
jgi:hypothetical protein